MLRNTLNTFITATLIMLLGVSSSASAQEEDEAPLRQMHLMVPAGDLMSNTSVTFGDQTLEDKWALVYVPLAPSAPEITLSEGDESGDWIIEVTTSRVYTYAVTSTANGLDTYSLAAVYNEPDSKNIASSPTVTPNTPISLDLGATAAISRNGKVITVPYDKDGGEGEGSVNGIKALDTVVIGGTTYPVTSVSNKADELSKITLGGDDPAPSIALGTRIAERGKFEVTVSGVALAEEDEGAGTADFTITATSSEDHKATQPLSFAVLVPVEPSFEKYVRNVTTPVEIEAGEGETTDHEDSTFYSQGVSAEEGNVLEYLIVLNAGNQGEHTKIILNEALSPFVEYLSGSAKVLGVEIADNEDGTSPILKPGGWTVKHYTNNSLILPPDGSATITYQVTVMGGDEIPTAKILSSSVAVGSPVTYSGCLVYEDNPEGCKPDGFKWGKFLKRNKAFPYKKLDHTACWRDITEEDGEWEVGANGVPPQDSLQDDIRIAAARDLSPNDAFLASILPQPIGYCGIGS